MNFTVNILFLFLTQSGTASHRLFFVAKLLDLIFEISLWFLLFLSFVWILWEFLLIYYYNLVVLVFTRLRWRPKGRLCFRAYILSNVYMYAHFFVPLKLLNQWTDLDKWYVVGFILIAQVLLDILTVLFCSVGFYIFLFSYEATWL